MKIRSLQIKQKSIAFTFALSTLFVFALNASFTKVYGQDTKKIIRLAPAINSQLKFTDVKVNEQPIEFGKEFNADMKWIENLTFKLENISNKPIVYLGVSMNFPETKTTGNLMSYTKSFGQRPDSKLKTNNNPMLLKPGETLEIALKTEKDRIIKFVSERQPFEAINQLDMEIGFIIFEDKTVWSAGTLLRQDPNNPDRYVPISNQP